MADTISTGGGASVGSDVSTGGGAFFGRDKMEGGVVVNVDSEGRRVTMPPPVEIHKDLDRLFSLIDGDPSRDIIGLRARVRELLELYNKLDNRVRILTILIAIEGVILVAVLIAVLIQLRGGA